MGLNEPGTAAAMFKQALQMDATNTAAQVHFFFNVLLACKGCNLGSKQKSALLSGIAITAAHNMTGLNADVFRYITLAL